MNQFRFVPVQDDLPLKWLLNPLTGKPERLAQYAYGRLLPVEIAGMSLKVLPLCHPRQAARLGVSSEEWFETHKNWEGAEARGVLA